MAAKQYYGIKYPFSNDNLDNVYMDLDGSYEDSVKSKILHMLFTPKGQRLRNPNFGTNLVKFLSDPNDEITIEGIKNELREETAKFIPNTTIDDITVYEDGDNGKVVIVKYSVKKGNAIESTSVGVKI